MKSPSQALRSARRHTFVAPAERVAQIHPGSTESATLLLPSLRSAPLDSPELVRVVPRPSSRSGPMLLPWSVPVVRLAAADVLTVAAALEEPAEAVRYGASVRYLAELAAFAGDLAHRGRVLPAVWTAAQAPSSRRGVAGFAVHCGWSVRR